MKRIHTRVLGPVLGLLLALTLAPLSGFAQVPHDMAYQGRLTDAVGAPLTGLVDLKLRIFDVPSAGTALYTEDHTGVVLDDNGAFTVRLGTGSLKVGAFDGALFSGVNRYLEVVVDGEVLTPRQPLSSVPYALQAEQAGGLAADPQDCPAGQAAQGIDASGTPVCVSLLAGPEGPQGPIGLTGAEGAMGERGLIGLTGADGAQGAQGSIGLTGATGAAGAIGPEGPAGPIGPQGPHDRPGSSNTAVGQNALLSNVNGNSNTASGSSALFRNTGGSFNNASGWRALQENTSGSSNTASGANALFSNTTGVSNTASGASALQGNTTGIFNTATGRGALQNNTDGGSNTAIGASALLDSTSGDRNIALGHLAGRNLTTGSDNIMIGNQGVAAESSTIRIGTPGTHTVTHLTGNVLIDGAPIAGAEGPAGPAGPQGDQGDQGIQGIPGLPGANGANGATGATGAQGPIGLTGPEGPQGIPGAAGTDHTLEIAALQGQLAALEALVESYHPTSRFIACVDGLTVADTATGLLWERKTGTFDASFPASGLCETAPGGCPDRHNVNNRYEWSNTGTAADGNAYTDFLFNLNAGSGFAGHTDWRLPFISELQSILIGSGVAVSSTNVNPPDPAMGTNPTGQEAACGLNALCIDPEFAAIGGPTGSSPYAYWSASSTAGGANAWYASFAFGFDFAFNPKTNDNFVRAVRAGSCGS